MGRRSVLILLFVVSFAYVSRGGQVIYVDVDSPNDPGSGSFTDPFCGIQDAINATGNGDVVEIREGIYTGLGNCDLDPNGKSITIRSTNPEGMSVVANTVIELNGAGRGFYFHSGEDVNCVVSGLTIRGANIPDSINGICCVNSNPTIRNCIIENGHATDSGGGIYCDTSMAKIIDCIIINNTAESYGGGISCIFSSPVIIGCTISGNAAFEGGGIDCWFSNPSVINCIITNNEAYNGAGVNCCSPGPTGLVSCTVTRNRADNLGGALYCQFDASADLENSILWANESGQGMQLALSNTSIASASYCNVQGGQAEVYMGTGCTLTWDTNSNMDFDPCFASFDPNGDPNIWDFHLQSAYGRWEPNNQDWATDTNTSSCIDTGDPNLDWSGEPWPNGKRINMGAYGGTRQASMNGNAGDFDINGVVNFQDFCELANKWGLESSYIEDLSGNGVVEFSDLESFVENWLWQCP